MVQDDDPVPGAGADRANQPGPVADARIRGLRAGREGEGVEVPRPRRDLVADDRREFGGDAHAPGRRGQVGRQVVVIRGDRQLDPLAGQGDGPLVDRGVAVAAVRQGVDVRVAGDQAAGRHLAADREVQSPSIAVGQGDRPRVHTVLEPAGCRDRVTAGRQADRGPAVRRVDDPRPRREAGLRSDNQRGQGTAVVGDRDPAGQPGLTAGFGDADLERCPAQGLTHGAVVERDPLDDHVVGLRRRADRQAVLAVAQGAGGHRQGMHQGRLHGVQPPDGPVVEADVPAELHVPLPDQEGRLGRVRPPFPPQHQALALRLGPGELSPLRPARRPQVMAV